MEAIKKQVEFKEGKMPKELEDQMKLFVNMIIDRVLEDRKQGIYRS